MASTTPVAILSSLLLQIKLLHVQITQIKMVQHSQRVIQLTKLQDHYFIFHLQIRVRVLELNSLCKTYF